MEVGACGRGQGQIREEQRKLCLRRLLTSLVILPKQLFLGCSACSYVVLGLFRLFLACSWVVQVVLGLFRGVPSVSNKVWKKFKPLFSNSMVNEKIVLIENDKIIRDDKDISQHFNEYFANITDRLNVPKFPAPPVQLTGDPVLDAIQKYASHPSILMIKAMAQDNGWFKFSSVDTTLVFSEICKMDSSKKTSGAIPTDKLKTSLKCLL